MTRDEETAILDLVEQAEADAKRGEQGEWVASGPAPGNRGMWSLHVAYVDSNDANVGLVGDETACKLVAAMRTREPALAAAVRKLLIARDHERTEAFERGSAAGRDQMLRAGMTVDEIVRLDAMLKACAAERDIETVMIQRLFQAFGFGDVGMQ